MLWTANRKRVRIEMERQGELIGTRRILWRIRPTVKSDASGKGKVESAGLYAGMTALTKSSNRNPIGTTSLRLL